ncbi:MAG: hypothetical protein CME65_08970 [Halobacteriovoraceae bacterium]|nr:hypothetical protein [Halobacteriovoraceae bacterium]|tara:strand:+ start:1517 stop:2167 length:651 start_codon:yes stop_codon:yes gene_type:complete
MKYLVIFMLSMGAFAQEAEVLNLVDEIKDEIRFENHDRRTLIQVRRNLEQALNTLRGGSPIPRPGRGSLTCIDRDRDGRDPYVLGFLNQRTLGTNRIEGTNVGSLNQCQSIVNNSIDLDRVTILTCISKDNDGRDPWSPAIIKNGVLIKRLPSLGSLSDCINAIDLSISNRFAVSLCVSRDNDGRSPFMRIGYELSTGNVSNGATYSSLEQCSASK